MKTPDSRPRFQSATRHYHRYREENRDGWNDWVDGSRKTGKPGSGRRLRWSLAVAAILGVAGLLGVVFYTVL